MYDPSHSGETLREDVLPALALTITEAAKQLGVTRAALSRVLNGKAAISPEIALDSSDHHLTRLKAVTVLVKQAPANYFNELLPLLQLPVAQDPEDEIAGALLCNLYPIYINTKQAIVAIRPPRQKFIFGQYRLFWECKFLKLIPDYAYDRGIEIDALMPLLTKNADFISMKAFAKIFMSLLIFELNNPELEIERLGNWLIGFAEWIRYHGNPDQKIYESFSKSLKARNDLGASLLRWRLSNWQKNREFLLWFDMPFLEELESEIEISIWEELCRAYNNVSGLRCLDC